MSVLVKTRSLVHLTTWKEPHYFGISDEGVDSSVRNIELKEEAWLDMGCPSQITVTVEPGDTLNGPTA